MRMLAGTAQEQTLARPAIVGEEPSAEAVEISGQGIQQGCKLRTSIEKKVENIWLESEELGWSYNDFVAHLLEVLIVLNYRGTKLTAKKADTK
jgi:hypothetical protein